MEQGEGRDGGVDGHVDGAVLVGGASRRMGGDKAWLDLGGRPMLLHVVDRLAAQTRRTVLVAHGDPGPFTGLGLPVICDRGAPTRQGPLAGIAAALDWATGCAEPPAWLVVAATDTPFLPADLVDRLLSAADAGPARVACPRRGDRLHPLPVLLGLDASAQVKAALRGDRRRLEDVWRPLGLASAAWDATRPDPFLNVNAPDDLAAARARLAAEPEPEPGGANG